MANNLIGQVIAELSIGEIFRKLQTVDLVEAKDFLR